MINWQVVFFALGSIFIGMWLLFLLLLIIGAIILFQRTRDIQEKLTQKIDQPMVKALPFLLPLLPLIMPLVRRVMFRKK